MPEGFRMKFYFAVFALFLLLSSPLMAVVGGSTVPSGVAPWMVALVNKDKADNITCSDSGGSELFCKQYCGGVLISPNWVMTAAHCVDNSLATLDDLVLVIGGHDLNSPDPLIATAVEKIVHPQHFVNPSYDNDIALLRLDAAAVNTPASLVESSDHLLMEADSGLLNDELSLFGYGRLSSNGDFPSSLQQVRLDLADDNTCAVQYNSQTTINYYGDLMLCVHEPDAASIEPDDEGDKHPEDVDGEDACTLDSGGPLFDAVNSGRVMGLVSFGDRSNCGVPERPSVYTQIEAFTDWIESSTRNTNYPLGDVALEITSVNSATPGNDLQFEVGLANLGGFRSFESPIFVVDSSALELSLAGVESPLSCEHHSANKVQCAFSGELKPGIERKALFSLRSSSSEEAKTLLSTKLKGDYGQDFRSDNNQLKRVLTFTNKPDIAIYDSHVVVRSNGDIVLFLDLINASSHVNAKAVGLVLNLSDETDYVYQSALGGACDTSEGNIDCAIGDMMPGEAVTLEVRLNSPSTVNSSVRATMVSSNGDFPQVTANGESDTSIFIPVSFDGSPVDSGDVSDTELPSQPAAGGSSGGGGGSLHVSLFLIFLLVLLGRFSRTNLPSASRF